MHNDGAVGKNCDVLMEAIRAMTFERLPYRGVRSSYHFHKLNRVERELILMQQRMCIITAPLMDGPNRELTSI